MKEITKRVLAGFCLAPPIVAVFVFLPAMWLFLLVALISLLAVVELVRMTDMRGKYFLALLAALSLIPLYNRSLQVFVLWLLFSPALYLIAVSLSRKGDRETINHEIMAAAGTLFRGEMFIIFPLFYVYLLKGLNPFLPLILLFAIWASDIGAYAFGKSFGKRPLVPLISPKKTYEGLGGAIFGGMVVLGFSHKVLGLGLGEALILGAILGILGQTGDIFESIWKRVSNVKDSSSLIPGHGGILDRMDSFIFTAPFLYHYLAGFET